MYERELKDYGGPELIRWGLKVVKSSDRITALATQYARTVKSITVPDAFAIALAKSHGWQLLAGDGGLEKHASAVGFKKLEAAVSQAMAKPLDAATQSGASVRSKEEAS